MRGLHLLISPFQHPMRANLPDCLNIILGFETRSLYMALVILELTMQTKLALNSEINFCLPLPPECRSAGIKGEPARLPFILLNFNIQSHTDPRNQVLPLQVSDTGHWRGFLQKGGPEALQPRRSFRPSLFLSMCCPSLSDISLDSCRQATESALLGKE